MLKDRKVDPQALTEVGHALAFPELPEGLGASNERLRHVAEARWPFNPAHLLAAAREQTGLSDFGGDYFYEALDRLCHSAEQDLELSPVGRRNLYGQILDHLVQRLRFQDLWKRHPEILDEPIEAPIVIVGLPRSGTTFLQQLLAQHPGLRAVPFWENLAPLPQHDPAIRPPDDRPLIEQAERNVEGLRKFAPGLLALHQVAAEEPEEEIYLLGPGFASMVYEWVYILPSFARWYAAADHTKGYQHFRQVLQTLQWMRGGGRRWLLKAPQHMEQLGPLRSAFPDAVIVETLRDPLTAAASNANLCCYGQRLRTDAPDPFAAGEASAGIIERLVLSYLRDRPDGDPHFVSVPFADLMRDPLTLASHVLERAGLEVTDAVPNGMADYVARNNEKPREPVGYAPADFGIDVAALRRKLAPYYEKFGITPDPRFPS
ncbi:sulfotransferase family protein [Novosphingobium cyanobacteriorum]|uniref:Sulfotransferase n=1 Tax=Novosphingobium cyanobacteriorum TaxID=3024215 RepID=A0ABT6CM42_9SPHN|nr:sulfotransferase [Novosphingobium cyanobacteriorum]MDF8334932.1 sulfotransferase [Novosphingobium cyanobacteriorum]